jgi:lipoate-protein ligase A
MLIPLPNAFGDAANNMALDTVLLETCPSGSAIFRHYGWTEPTFTFGYTQAYSELSALAPVNTTLCRRPTGGGIVDHRNDWTYALILNANTLSAKLTPVEFYQQIHETLQAALASHQIDSTLAPCPKACRTNTEQTQISGSSQCFINPVANDLLTADGQKIAGAALKRTRNGLLLQGSIDQTALPKTFNYKAFQQSLIEAIAETLSFAINREIDLRTLFDQPLIESHRQHFLSTEWLKKR